MNKTLYLGLIRTAKRHRKSLVAIVESLADEPVGNVSMETFMDMEHELSGLDDNLGRAERYAKAFNPRRKKGTVPDAH